MAPLVPRPLPPKAARVAFFCAILAVAALLLLPSPDAPGVGAPGVDKIVHAGLFLGLGVLGAFAYPAYGRWLLFGLLVAYGGLLELAQGAVPGRHPDAWDLLADAAGASAVLFIGRGRPPGELPGG